MTIKIQRPEVFRGKISPTPLFSHSHIRTNERINHLLQITTQTKLAKLPSLAKFKNIALLTDNNTQSSAEIMAATFKRFNVAIVGKTTRGWGTIENTFPMETLIDPVERYSLFLVLVYSITFRDDGQPIEGRGIDPHVDIAKPGWEKELADYMGYRPLLEAVKNMATKSPLK